MYYLIKESLSPCAPEDLTKGGAQYVAVLTTEEWQQRRDCFDMLIDMDMETVPPQETKAIVNQDSLTGTFSIPDRTDISGTPRAFSFALDEKGIVLVDDSLLETTIGQDLALLEKSEHRLNQLEEAILRGEIESYPAEMNDIRGNLLDLRIHYEQLIDFSQELEENENDFFREENLRYFHMFTERVIRLQDMVSGQREYVTQLRDLIQSHLDVKQNRIMTVLTVITSIFLPLTLIAGWYGMNFRYMPELEWRFGYPLIIVISILIVILCLFWFKKKKWM